MGTLLGVIGSGFGALSGLIALKYRQLIAQVLGIWDKKLYKLDYVPAYYEAVDVLIVFLASVLICAIAALIPAVIAAAINPVKALQSKG